MRNVVTAPLVVDLYTRRRCLVSLALQPLYPWRTRPQYSSNRRLDVPRSRSGRFWWKEKLLSLRWQDHESSGFPCHILFNTPTTISLCRRPKYCSWNHPFNLSILYPILCAVSFIISNFVCRIMAVPVSTWNRRYRCTMECPEGKDGPLHRALMLERCSFPVPFVVKCQRQSAPFAKHIPKCVHGTVRIIFHRNWYIFRENKVLSVAPEGTKEECKV
jgi:hypothetical protein